MPSKSKSKKPNIKEKINKYVDVELDETERDPDEEFDEEEYDEGYDEEEEEEEEQAKKKTKTKAKPKQNKKEEKEEGPEVPVHISSKIKTKLKTRIMQWMDVDDKIKEINVEAKRYKDEKKQMEDSIVGLMTQLGFEEENKISIKDINGTTRGKVYKVKAVTKSPLKAQTIQGTLMEIFHGNEGKVAQVMKKIENNRELKERVYLKRTKGKDNF